MGLISVDKNKKISDIAYDGYGEAYTENQTDSEIGSLLANLILSPVYYRGYLGVFLSDGELMYFLGSRFYHPRLCRFFNADIHTDTQQGAVGTNMFAYCNNNPINFIDPTGTTAETKEEGNYYGFLSSLFSVILICLVLQALNGQPIRIPTISTSSANAKSAAESRAKNAHNKIVNFTDSCKDDEVYRTAELVSDNFNTYVVIGEILSFNEAKVQIYTGRNVFASSHTAAENLFYATKMPGVSTRPERHSSKRGYYWHYHPYGHEQGNDNLSVHIWYR